MSNRKRKFTILVDKTLGEAGFFLSRLFYWNRKKEIKKEEIKNILIIRPGGIGDFLLSVPAFKKIRKLFPEAKVTIFVFKRNKSCLELYSDFDKKVVIDEGSEFKKFLFSKKDYDLVFDFDQHRKISSIIAKMSKANIRVGFRNNGKEKAYNYPIDYFPSMYEAQSFLSLLSPLTSDVKLSEEDLLIKKGERSPYLKKGKNIGIYAAAMKEENRLPVEEWKKIISEHGKEANYYFLGGEKDKERYDKIEKELEGYNIVRVDGKTSLRDSFNLISDLDLLTSEDGGTYHLGVCAGIPTVSYWLHGKDNMKKWKAPFKQHKEEER